MIMLGLSRWRHFYMCPFLGSLAAIVTIIICQFVAIHGGHLTIVYKDAVFVVAHAPISLTGNHFPERGIYGAGMCVAAIMFGITAPQLRAVLSQLDKVWQPCSIDEGSQARLMTSPTSTSPPRVGREDHHTSTTNDDEVVRKTMGADGGGSSRHSVQGAGTNAGGFRVARHPPNCCCKILSFISTAAIFLLVVSCLALVCQGLIPLQKDLLTRSVEIKTAQKHIYEAQFRLDPQSYVHLIAAGIFFAASYLHGFFVFLVLVPTHMRFWQNKHGAAVGGESSGVTEMPVSICSSVIKGAALVTTSFTRVASKAIMPHLMNADLPEFVESVCLQGIEQRLFVLCIIVYVASYSLDLYRATKHMKDDSVDGTESGEKALKLKSRRPGVGQLGAW